MLSKATPILPAEDMARAKAFWTQKVGLSLMQESDMWATLQLPDGSMIGMYPHERTRATHTAFGLQVDDLEKEMAELKSRGVVFEEYDQPGLKTVNGVAEADGMKSAWFVDSEGNTIGLAQFS